METLRDLWELWETLARVVMEVMEKSLMISLRMKMKRRATTLQLLSGSVPAGKRTEKREESYGEATGGHGTRDKN